jgi:hypothetical protein
MKCGGCDPGSATTPLRKSEPQVVGGRALQDGPTTQPSLSVLSCVPIASIPYPTHRLLFRSKESGISHLARCGPSPREGMVTARSGESGNELRLSQSISSSIFASGPNICWSSCVGKQHQCRIAREECSQQGNPSKSGSAFKSSWYACTCRTHSTSADSTPNKSAS